MREEKGRKREGTHQQVFWPSSFSPDTSQAQLLGNYAGLIKRTTFIPRSHMIPCVWRLGSYCSNTFSEGDGLGLPVHYFGSSPFHWCLGGNSTSRKSLWLSVTNFPVFGLRSLTVFSKWVKFTQSCPTLCDPMDYTVHGILQARILDWVAFPFCRGSSQLRDRTQVSRTAGGFFSKG